jgi:beta-lactamase superfamily II metal-dependent hydrolase
MMIPIHDALLQIFDVEHGACGLLTAPLVGGGFGRLMVDCGHNGSMPWYPGDHLKGLGISYIDLLAITNYDEDHVSGYPNMLARGINIGWMIRNKSVSPQTIKLLKTEDGMGKGIDALVGSLDNFGPPAVGAMSPQFAGVHLEWFNNSYPAFDDENNLSTLLHLDIQGVQFIFPGDLEMAGWKHLLNTNARLRQLIGSTDVLIAAHHGRENGICEDIFDVWGCKPKIVIISDDYKQYDTQNTIGYYNSKCVGITPFRGKLDKRKVLTTRQDGELRFCFQNGACTVS